MSHEHEVYTSPFGLTTATFWKLGVKRYTRAGILCGDYLRAERDASHHSPPDQHGWRAPTPYFGNKTVEYAPVVDYWYHTYGLHEGRDYAVRAGAIPDPNDALWNQLKAEAETLCLGKFASATVDLSVAFGERKECANLVFNVVDGLTNFVRNLKKGRISARRGEKIPQWLKKWRAGDRIDTLPNAWLTWRYGVEPTVLDVYDAVLALESADNGTFDRYIISQRSRRKTYTEYQLAPTNQSFGLYYVLPVKVHEEGYTKHEVMVRLDAKPGDQFYLQLQDVGVTNLPLTLWELTGYSHIADWFVGVGDFLEAINAREGYTFKGGTCTKYFDAFKAKVYVPNPTKTNPTYTGGIVGLSSGDYRNSIQHMEFNRTVYSDFPMPSLVLKRDPLNFTRMWDGIFTLSSVLGNKKAARTADMRRRGIRI